MYNLVEKDVIKSIQQNIRLILTTPKGSDIHRPNFGSDLWKFIDQPLNAITLGRIKTEIIDAIGVWEPRARVLSVEIEKNHIRGRLKVSIFLEIKELGKTTEVKLWL